MDVNENRDKVRLFCIYYTSHGFATLYIIFVSSPDLIQRVYRFQYNVPRAILKAIRTRVGFGFRTETSYWESNIIRTEHWTLSWLNNTQNVFCSKNSGAILITSCSREKRYQALPATYLCSREGEPGNKAMAAWMQKTLHIRHLTSRPSVRLFHWLHTFAWVRQSDKIIYYRHFSIHTKTTTNPHIHTHYMEGATLKLQSTHTYINTTWRKLLYKLQK